VVKWTSSLVERHGKTFFESHLVEPLFRPGDQEWREENPQKNEAKDLCSWLTCFLVFGGRLDFFFWGSSRVHVFPQALFL